jgi:glycosyltransferase involved in cell wall biosynthesis
MVFQAGARSGPPRISAVIPVLNEARNLPHVLSLLSENVHELILVDGHSVDDSVRVAREICPDVRVVMQTRRGKGNALACGFTAATGDIIVTIDADGSADPGEIPLFIKALTEGADFAKGTRFAAGGGSHDITRLRRFGNSVLSALVNRLYGTRYTDLCYGLNAFWKRVVPDLGLAVTAAAPAPGGSCLWGDGFEIETLVNIRAARAGLVITEVPSVEHARIHGVSNLNALTDGFRVLRTILHERFNPRRRPKHMSAASPPSRAEHNALKRLLRLGSLPAGHGRKRPRQA